MTLDSYRRLYRTAFVEMVGAQQYHLAWRIFRLHRKTLRLHKAKLRHNRRLEKVQAESAKLHGDISALSFGAEIDFYNAYGENAKEEK